MTRWTTSWRSPANTSSCSSTLKAPAFHSPAALGVEPIRRDPRVLRQALIGLLIGAALVVGVWVLPIPVVDWIAIVIGSFLVLMALYSVVVWVRE